MHIYDKQCGIIQKINRRFQTFRFSVFTMGRQELCAENAKKTQKLGKHKHPLLNFSNNRTHPGLHHVEEHARGFPKMYIIWGWI